MSLFPKYREAPVYPIEGNGEYNEVFRKIPLDSFPKPPAQQIVTVGSNSSLSEACQILADADILSAPIRNVHVASDASWMDKYPGIADFLGIIDWMMDRTRGLAPKDLRDLRSIRDSFSHTKASTLPYHATQSPFIPIDPNESDFLEIMILLGKYSMHRVWLVNSPGGDIINVITQQGALDQLTDKMSYFTDLTNKSLTDLGLATPNPVVCVSSRDTFWDAFCSIRDHFVSGVGVVDDRGRLVNNISATDLKNLIRDPYHFQAMARPIADFVDTSGFAVQTCTPKDTLEDVMRRMQATRVHRLYIVDAEHKPLSVVSIRDVLAQFVRESQDCDMSSYFMASSHQ